MVERLYGKKVIGIKQSIKAISSGQGDIVYIAKDADEKLIHQIHELAIENSVEVIFVDTMQQLGKLCGIDVGASATVILKD